MNNIYAFTLTGKINLPKDSIPIYDYRGDVVGYQYNKKEVYLALALMIEEDGKPPFCVTDDYDTEQEAGAKISDYDDTILIKM